MKKHYSRALSIILLSTIGFIVLFDSPLSAMDKKPTKAANQGISEEEHAINVFLEKLVEMNKAGHIEKEKIIQNMKNNKLVLMGMHIPPEIANLKNLKELHLSQCIITGVHFGNFKNLEKLSLVKCNIITLPVEICNLINLTYLDIKNNLQLTYLPDTFGQLVNLRSLDISYTEINYIPGLNRLLNLMTIKVIKNPLEKKYKPLPPDTTLSKIEGKNLVAMRRTVQEKIGARTTDEIAKASDQTRLGTLPTEIQAHIGANMVPLAERDIVQEEHAKIADERAKNAHKDAKH